MRAALFRRGRIKKRAPYVIKMRISVVERSATSLTHNNAVGSPTHNPTNDTSLAENCTELFWVSRSHGCRQRPTSSRCASSKRHEGTERVLPATTAVLSQPRLYYRAELTPTRHTGTEYVATLPLGVVAGVHPAATRSEEQRFQTCHTNLVSYQQRRLKIVLADNAEHLGHTPSLQCGTASTWS